MKKNKLISLLLAFIATIGLVSIDITTKYFVDKNMPLGSSKELIPGVFELHYIRNAGAAWGILQNKQIIFYILTVFVMIFAVYLYYKLTDLPKYNIIRILIVFIVSGAIGNFIDRIRFKYVIDFLYFRLINFPVFNVADIYVTLSFIILILLMFTKYKDDDIWEEIKNA